MTTSLSHVALLVPSVEGAALVLSSYGIKAEDAETFESEGTKEVYVGSYGTQRGLLLLLEAISDGPYKRAMIKRGPSLHHLAIDVLDVANFGDIAQGLGWKLHPISAQTLAHKTAWLFCKGIPTLIEVHQKKELSSKPSKISKLKLPLHSDQLALFAGIGLGDLVSRDTAIGLTIDGHDLSFAELASRHQPKS